MGIPMGDCRISSVCGKMPTIWRTFLKRSLPHIIVLGLYLLLALVLTWPLAMHLTTHLPGSAEWAFDESTFAWNMWWFQHSLLDLQQSPLHTNHIFYPLGIDLVLYTFNFFNAMLGLPLLLVAGLPLASNLVILAAFVLSGYGGYLLVCYLLTPCCRGAAGRAREDSRSRPSHLACGDPQMAGCASADRHRAMSGTVTGDRLAVRTAAFIAGAAYAFAASRMVYAALGHYDMVTAQWFPFYALFFLKTVREPGTKNAVLAGLCAAFALLAEMIFGVFLLFLSLILLMAPHPLHPLSTKWRGERGVRLLGRLLVLALTVAVVWSPVMLPVLDAFTQSDYALTGWGEGLKLSADLVGWFTPTALHPLFGVGNWPAYLRSVVEGRAPTLDVNTVFLGFGILALALLGAAVAWRRARAWAWGAVLFAVFTLGPLLQINGRYLFPLDNLLREQGLAQDVTFPLPYALLHYLPIIQANRAPNRFSVVLSLALAVLAGYGAAWLLRKAAGPLPSRIQPHPPSPSPRSGEGGKGGEVHRRLAVLVVGAVLLGVVLFDQVSAPLPLSDARVPAAYAAIAAETDDYAILQLPLGWRNSFGTLGAEQTQLQYYQAFHHKRTLAGNISRAPAFKFDYFRRIPLFYALTETEMYRTPDDVTLARATEQAGELLALYDVRYLVIHEPIPLRYPYVDTITATRTLALSLLPHDPEPVADADGARVYRLMQPPLPDPLRVDFGDWRAAPYRGEGWGDDEEIFGATANWAIGTQARLFFPVRGAGGRRLGLQIAPFGYPDAPGQTLTLDLNDRPLRGSFDLADGWQIIGVTLPADRLQPGLNTLTLHFGRATTPAAVLGVPDDRLLAAAVDWMEVSGGE
jgi:hypothetical protein